MLPTRFGPLLIEADERAVVRSGFVDAPLEDAGPHPVLLLAAAAVADWDSGLDLSALDRVPLAICGDGFGPRVWRALRGVPAGRTVSYAELAALAGSPRAARAAGRACADNPLAPFVPCHRVLRASGEVGGYVFGPDRKAAMLAHEAAARGS